MGQWQSQPLCTTPACVHTAGNILQNLHPQWKDMDPCTDFGEMVCHGFKQHNPVDVESLMYTDRINKRIMQSVLGSPDHATAAALRSTHLTARGLGYDEHNFDLLRTAYQTCMNTSAVTAAGLQPLIDLMASVNETWPVTDFTSKVGSDYDGLFKATFKLEELGIPALYSLCETDMPLLADADEKIYYPCVTVPKLLNPSLETYNNPAAVEGLVVLYAQVLQMLYPTLEKEAVMALAEAVAAFETDNAKLHMEHKLLVDPIADLESVPLAQANAGAPALRFEKLMTTLAGRKPSKVLLDMPNFWPDYSKMIAKHPKAAIQGFMALRAGLALSFHVESAEFHKLFNPSTAGERGLDCVTAVTSMASELVDSYFIRAAYNDQSQRVIAKMATNVVAAFRKRVGELEWMGPESRQRAIAKVDNMVQNIGYRTDKSISPDLLSGESLATYYSDLNVTTASHFANMLAGMRHKTAKAYAQVDKPLDRSSFLKPVSGPNALYYMPANALSIPAGVTQLPAFHHQLPDYALYGGVGSVIGHEITHGFDSNGRYYDEHGAFGQSWDNSSMDNFDDRSQCFVDQFGAWEVDVPGGKANVSGEITLAENIADAGGLRVAYDAWQAERAAMPSTWNQDLPGLDMFTHEQLFFIMFGTNWCSSYSDAKMKLRLTHDNHAPATARVALTAQNSRGFKEAFKCKTKEPTCEIF